MLIDALNKLFAAHKEVALSHRYINSEMIAPLLDKLPEIFDVEIIGKSVNGLPIHAINLGNGPKKIFMWSQMHGNESTTTKAVFDILNTFIAHDLWSEVILKSCTIKIIPILNPDGAEVYTRINANKVDLNRDAVDLSQPESVVLRNVFNDFKPNFCFNLHGQRTIFSAGKTDNIATVSFLSPAEDVACVVTETRKKAMEVIAVMNAHLQTKIPNQVGVYDDSFNKNCVGDMFQTLQVPTILFEAGHYKDDYAREKTRQYMYESIMVGLHKIATSKCDGSEYVPYNDIPENGKLFYDIIIRDAIVLVECKEVVRDIAILYKEVLVEGKIEFFPKITKFSNLDGFFGHKEINANGYKVLGVNGCALEIGSENDFVSINNELYSLKLT
ncbi:M14 family zinc carboxypeptidase [Lacinutrix undariae]